MWYTGETNNNKLEFTHRVRGAGGTLYSTTRDPNWTKIYRQILINKFEKVCKLFEQATILQIAHFLNHVTPDPGCDLPSRGVQKDTPFGPRLQNDPILEPCHTISRWWFTIQRGPKTGSSKVFAFGGPRFWTRFAQILVQFASKHGPRSKIHFLDPCYTRSRWCFTIWRGSHFNLFLFGVTFWTPSDGKTPPGSGVTWSKKWSPLIPGRVGRRDGHEKFWFSWGRL